ncbi:unnamed protein product [Meloidogyne enterolobii]|uniref:Uncharacterized protein n=1 Tax=Meloidogyne enterolobii TaxID=390850 RepID=A0ACB0ZJL5_MELEN
MSCWNSSGNLCPDICRGFNFQEWINNCWNNFCNSCHNIFGNQNANQFDHQSVGGGEYQTEYNEEVSDGEVHEGEEQHCNTEEEWEEMPSASQGQTSRYHYVEEGEECEAEYEKEEYEEEYEEYDNAERETEELHSGHYNPDIHDQFGQMNIGGKFFKVNKRL